MSNMILNKIRTQNEKHVQITCDVISNMSVSDVTSDCSSTIHNKLVPIFYLCDSSSADEPEVVDVHDSSIDESFIRTTIKKSDDIDVHDDDTRLNIKKPHNIINNVVTMDVVTMDCDIINKPHDDYTRLNNVVTMNPFTNLLLNKNDNNIMD